MSNLLDLSGKIDPVSLALYETLSEVAGSMGVSFFVVGATARDMIFELGHGLPSKRATKDVDFGVRVASWDEFKKLKASLLTSGHFNQTKEVQRLQMGASVAEVARASHPMFGRRVSARISSFASRPTA
jgi:predicted nucleotidyltransferase